MNTNKAKKSACQQAGHNVRDEEHRWLEAVVGGTGSHNLERYPCARRAPGSVDVSLSAVDTTDTDESCVVRIAGSSGAGGSGVGSGSPSTFTTVAGALSGSADSDSAAAGSSGSGSVVASDII